MQTQYLPACWVLWVGASCKVQTQYLPACWVLWVGASCKVQTQYLPACWVLWVGASCKVQTQYLPACWVLWVGASCKVQTQYLPACWVLWVGASTRCKPSTYQPVGCSGLEPVQGANPVPTSLLGALGWSQYKVQTQYLPACWVLWVGASCKVQTQYLPACWVLWVGASCKVQTQYLPACWVLWVGASCKVQTQYLPACWVLWVGASTRCKPSTYQPVGCSGLEQGANPVPTTLLSALGWSQYKVQTQYLPACWVLWVGARCKPSTYQPVECSGLEPVARCKPSTYQPVGCSGLELVARCKPSTYQPVECSGLELVARCKPSTYQPVGCSGLEPVARCKPSTYQPVGCSGLEPVARCKPSTYQPVECSGLEPVARCKPSTYQPVGCSGLELVARCKPSTYQPVGCSGLEPVQGANPVPTSLLGALGWSQYKVQTQYLPACWVLWVGASTRCKPSTYQPVGCSGLEPVQGANPVPTSLLGALGWSQYKVQTQYLPACWVLWVGASTRCKPSTYQPVGCSGLEPVQGANPVPTSLLGALGWSQYKVQTQYLPACWVLWVGASTRCKPSTYQPVGCSGLEPVQGANPVPTSLLGALGWSKVQTQYLPACWVLWVGASTRCKPSTYQPVGCSGLEPVQGANPVPTSLLGALGWSQYKVQTQYLPACWVLWVGASTRCKPSTYQPVGCSGLEPVQGANPVPTSLLGALGWSQYKVQTQYLPACWVLWVGASTRCKPSTYQPVGCSGLEPVQGANPVPTSLLGALGWSQYKVQTQYLPACWVLWVGARCKPSTYQPVGCSGLEPVQGANPVPTSLLGALGWSQYKVQTQYLPACWVLWVGASTRCKPSTYQPVGCSGLELVARCKPSTYQPVECSGLEPVQGANPVPTSLLGALGWSKVQTQYLPACWVLWVGARCKPSTYQPVGCSGLEQGANPVPTSLLGALGWSKVQTQYLPACWVLWVGARCKPSTYQPVECSGLEPVQGANPVPTSLLGALGWSKVQTQYLPACWVLWVGASTRCKPSTYQPVGCSGLEPVQGANPVPTSLLGALGWSKVQTQYLPACWVLWVGASCKVQTQYLPACWVLWVGASCKVQTQYLPACWVLWVGASTRCKPSTYQPVECSGLEPVARCKPSTYQPVGCSGLEQGANPVPTSLLGALGWS